MWCNRETLTGIGNHFWDSAGIGLPSGATPISPLAASRQISPVVQPESNLESVGMVGSCSWNFSGVRKRRGYRQIGGVLCVTAKTGGRCPGMGWFGRAPGQPPRSAPQRCTPDAPLPKIGAMKVESFSTSPRRNFRQHVGCQYHMPPRPSASQLRLSHSRNCLLVLSREIPMILLISSCVSATLGPRGVGFELFAS